MMFRRRFHDVIRRQLELFEREHAELLARCEEAARAYERADREDAEERYGDYADLVGEGAEALAELRDNYAAALGDEAADEYEHEFNRAVLKRFKRFPVDIED